MTTCHAAPAGKTAFPALWATQGNGAKIGGRYVTNAVIIQKSLWGGNTATAQFPSVPSGSAEVLLRLRRGGPLESGEVGQGVLGGVAAHLLARPQTVADLGPVRAAEEPAEVVVVELRATHAGRLAAGHARDGRGDREGDAAGPAAGAADHDWEDNASAASIDPTSSRQGPRRVGSRNARLSAARKRARGHSAAPKPARCSV